MIGCYQKSSVYYFDIFAPVKKLTIVYTMLIVATIQYWYTHQMNVIIVFLHEKLTETMYIKLPKGYTHLESEISLNMKLLDPMSTLVCKLKTSLYGLRQAPQL